MNTSESPVKFPSYALLISKANAFRIIDNNLRSSQTKLSPKGREPRIMGYYEELLRAQLAITRRLINAEIYSDRIVICGQTIKRPSGVAPSQWFDIWESFTA